MGILIDIIVIGFILLCTFWGYKKGLVELGIRALSFLIAIIITFILYRPIAELVIHYTTIDELIQNTIVEKLSNENPDQENKSIQENIIEQTKDDAILIMAKTLSYNIIYGGVMILLFIITKIILLFVSALANIIEKLPIINQFNKAGGIAYGLVVGIFITCVVLLVISFIEKANTNSKINKQIEDTYITKIIYENNILDIFFK